MNNNKEKININTKQSMGTNEPGESLFEHDLHDPGQMAMNSGGGGTSPKPQKETSAELSNVDNIQRAPTGNDIAHPKNNNIPVRAQSGG